MNIYIHGTDESLKKGTGERGSLRPMHGVHPEKQKKENNHLFTKFKIYKK